MKQLFLLSSMLFLIISVRAQPGPFKTDTNDKRPYVVINGKHADPISLMLLDKADIENINVLSLKKSAKYGKRAEKFGAVELFTSKNAKLLNFNELIDLFHFKPYALKLSVVVKFGFPNTLNVQNPELLLISLPMVRSLRIKRDGIDHHPELQIDKRLEYDNTGNNTLDSLVNIFNLEAKNVALKTQILQGR